MKPIYIMKTGSYCENIENELPRLKQTVFDSTGKQIRRITRFIELALIGAARAGKDLPENSPVYLSSARGDMGVTIEALNRIYLEHQIPGPFNFINSVSNAACFNIAHTLGLNAASYFIANRYLSLESILQIACLDLLSDDAQSALVGVVDCPTMPLEAHRTRFSLPADTPLAEGSHWLQLTTQPRDNLPIGSLSLPIHFHNKADLETWIQNKNVENTFFSAGQSITHEERAQWLEHTQLAPLDYLQGIGHFDSQIGRTLCQFLEQGDKEATLLYINRDPNHRYAALQIKRF